jgi:hypothetical protein
MEHVQNEPPAFCDLRVCSMLPEGRVCLQGLRKARHIQPCHQVEVSRWPSLRAVDRQVAWVLSKSQCPSCLPCLCIRPIYEGWPVHPPRASERTNWSVYEGWSVHPPNARCTWRRHGCGAYLNVSPARRGVCLNVSVAQPRGLSKCQRGLSCLQEADDPTAPGGGVSRRTTELVSLILLPLSIIIILYALFVFYSRSVFLQKKQVWGPCGGEGLGLFTCCLLVHLCCVCAPGSAWMSVGQFVVLSSCSLVGDKRGCPK